MDARLRELDRRWRSSGEVEDKVRWLCERVRQSDLGRPVLESAALLGIREARLVLETLPEGVPWPTSLDNAVMMSLARMPPTMWSRVVEVLADYVDELVRTGVQAGSRLSGDSRDIRGLLPRMKELGDEDPLWDIVQAVVVGLVSGTGRLGLNYPLGWERVRDLLALKLGEELLG